MSKFISKCDFCQYATASGCMVTPDSKHCQAAKHELSQYIAERQGKKQGHQAKSFRSWDK